VTGALSFGQERLWFLDQLEPGTASYNIPLVLRLSGELDPGRLRAALAGLVERHEPLRTRFPSVDGRPHAAPGPAPLLQEATGDLATLLAERSNAPFDLAEGPLLRITLIRPADKPDEHVLSLVLHHIVADGWSLNLLRDELAARYAGTWDEVPLPTTYAAYAEAQRGAETDRDTSFWRERLTGAAPLGIWARHRPARFTPAGSPSPVPSTRSPASSASARSWSSSPRTSSCCTATPARTTSASACQSQGATIPTSSRSSATSPTPSSCAVTSAPT